jgi:1,4-alpha-glucan branching enzyme
MLKKQYVKSRKVAKITFELALSEIQAEFSAELPAESVFLVGEFNDWDPAATPMKYSKKKKAFTVTLDLEPGRQYQFRYVVDGDHWCNDWDADAYVPSEPGPDNYVVDNSVVDAPAAA